MPLEKLTGFLKLIKDLPDKPNSAYTALQIKEYFDSSPEELRLALNALIDRLKAVVDGDSGADNIGVTAIEGVDGATLQAVLESLKGIDDDNYNSLLFQLQGVALGQIPDGSVTEKKLAFNVATQPEFDAHALNDDIHKTTSEVRSSASNPLVVEVRTSDPTNPAIGRIWYRSDL